MDEYLIPWYKKALFWRFLIKGMLFLLFLVAFWKELTPALSGFWNLAVILIGYGFNLFNQELREQVFLVSGFNDVVLSHMGKILINILAYILVYWVSVFMVAQFALPIQEWKDRWKTFVRLFYFRIGWYGVTAFVREGKLIAKTGEDDTSNAGVILVDLSSAVVLSSQTWDEQKFHGNRDFRDYSPPEITISPFRVVGPGVNFIESGEKIRSIIDLRRQVRSTSGIKAITRDGIEIETGIFTVFSAGDPPDVIPVAYIDGMESSNLAAFDLEEDKENHKFIVKRIFSLGFLDANEIHSAVENKEINAPSVVSSITTVNKTITPYLFNENRVFAASCGDALSNSSAKDIAPWYELAQPICIDLFQNIFSQFSYDLLFSLKESIYSNLKNNDLADSAGEDYEDYSVDKPITPYKESDFLKTIKADLNFQMRCQGLISYKLVKLITYDEIRSVSNIDWKSSGLTEGGSYDASQIYMSEPKPLTGTKVLRERGVKVVTAGFTQIISPPEIHRQMVETWKARSEREISITLAKHERDAMQVINNARTQTQRENAYHLSNLFKEQKHSKEALALFLFQALENIATDPKSHKDLPPKEVLAMVQNLHRWLLIERKEMEYKRRRENRRLGNKEE